MPKGTKVARCVDHVEDQGHSKVSAIKICQSQTGDSYMTGTKSKNKKSLVDRMVVKDLLSGEVKSKKTLLNSKRKSNVEAQRVNSTEQAPKPVSIRVNSRKRGSSNRYGRGNTEYIPTETQSLTTIRGKLDHEYPGAGKFHWLHHREPPEKRNDSKTLVDRMVVKDLLSGTKSSRVKVGRNPNERYEIAGERANDQSSNRTQGGVLVPENLVSSDTQTSPAGLEYVGIPAKVARRTQLPNANKKSLLGDHQVIKTLFDHGTKSLLLFDKMLQQVGSVRIKSLLVDKLKAIAKDLDELEQHQRSLDTNTKEYWMADDEGDNSQYNNRRDRAIVPGMSRHDEIMVRSAGNQPKKPLQENISNRSKTKIVR